MDDIKSLVEKYSKEARIATANDKVYKDECVYSFDTSESQNGLFVCLSTFIGVAHDLLPVHFAKTGSHLYLHIKTWRREVKVENDEPEKKKPSKLGIGIEGGFDLAEKQFEFVHEHSLFVYPEDKQVKLIDHNAEQYLTESVRRSIESLQKAESVYFKEELANQAAAWDGEQRFVSKHSGALEQLPSPVQISPNPDAWKCEHCEIRKNLWLNLTDGMILCGRKQLDGSGGNNHAVEHYQKTRYPLAVKLGTITAKGADVYSYEEDDMVEDANLAVHLAHFGINMSKMEKTDKTMAELEIDLNAKVSEWDRIQESGSKLVPLYGPGYTGLRNLGNSCYMNSIMQVLFTVPDFVHKYVNGRDAYLKSSGRDPSNDFNLQMAKLGHGLLSGAYSVDPSKQLTWQVARGGSRENRLDPPLQVADTLPPPKGVKPHSFKSLIGRGHVEFSTKRQQDVHEFFTHLIAQVERHSHADTLKPADTFRVQFEERLECAQSRRVRYAKREDLCVALPVHKEAMQNRARYEAFLARKSELAAQGKQPEPSELVRPEIRLEDCLELFAQSDLVSDFYSSETKRKGDAYKTTRFVNFPDYLVLQMKKFEYAADWSPVKLDVAIQVPDTLDLTKYRATGLKAGELELADDGVPEQEQAAETAEQLDEGIVGQLVDMGFNIYGSQRAAYHTRDLKNAEAAVNWAVAHMEDADFEAPFEVPRKATATAKAGQVYNEESIASIMSWGFSRAQAIKALEATNNNVERAADWIFSHTDELMSVDTEPAPSASPASAPAPAGKALRDGNGVYQLVAFVSHMGTNANVGHYVAHILKDAKWAIFNDENVAASENPPKELAYLYFYKRV